MVAVLNRRLVLADGIIGARDEAIEVLQGRLMFQESTHASELKEAAENYRNLRKNLSSMKGQNTKLKNQLADRGKSGR